MTLDLTEFKKRLQPKSALALTLEPDRMVLSLVRHDDGGDLLSPHSIIARLEPALKANRIAAKTLHALSALSGSGIFAPLAGTASDFGLKPLQIGIGAEELVNDPDKAGMQLAAALESSGIKERRCVVGIPPAWALTASAELPEISPDDLRGYFELRAEREFSVSVADLRLAYCPYTLPDGTRRATLAAVPAKRLEAVEKALAAAGCRALSISLALDDCLNEPQPVLHFLAGRGHTDVVVSAGGGVALLRSLGGLRATDEAPFDVAAFCREIRITLGRLPEPLPQAVRIAHFSGECAPELQEATGGFLLRLGIQSQQCAGDSALSIPDQSLDAAADCGAAVESAKRQLRREPVAFEFVQVEPSRWPEKLQWFKTHRGRWITAAVAGVGLLLLLVFVIRSKMESSLQNEWSGMNNSVAELDLYQQKIRQFHPWFDHTPQDMKVLESFIAAFPEQGEVWAKSVQVIAPGQGDVWIKATEGAGGHKINCSGFARNQPALIAFLDRLRARHDFSAVLVQQLRGENPIQFSLTCKWEPIHDK